MDVQHGVAPEVSQRRDLVRPAPVVELIVFVGNRRLPARVEESMLDFLDTRARHHEVDVAEQAAPRRGRSEEHTSELQSLMRISYAVFCLKKKNKNTHHDTRLQYVYTTHSTVHLYQWHTTQ